MADKPNRRRLIAIHLGDDRKERERPAERSKLLFEAVLRDALDG